MNKSLLRKNAEFTRRVQSLLDTLETYDETALNRRPASGGWSALQVAEHLILAERLSLTYVQKKIGYGGAFEKRGLSSSWRRMMLWTYMNLPIKFKAPGVVAEENLPQHSTLEDVRRRWMALRAEWTAFLENLSAEYQDKAIYKHPFAGRLGWPETLAFFTMHLERHTGQIRRTLA